MSDRLFMALIAAVAVVMIGFSAVWPQGLGARSPWPFGHTPVQQTPAMRAVMAREAARAVARNQAHVAAATAQLRRVSAPLAPTPAAPPAAASAGPDGLRPTQ